MGVKMALRRFTLRAAGGFRGRDGAQQFLLPEESARPSSSCGASA